MDRSRALMDRLVSWSPVLLLGGLAALTYWLDAQIQSPALRNDGSHRHDVDIYVENVRATSFGTDGNPTQLLSAARGEHYPDDDTTVFFKPDLVIKDPKQPTFAITADLAKIGGDRDNAWFTGNVRARREADPDAPKDAKDGGASTLATEYLHVLVKQKLADTDKAVTLEDSRGIIHAVGMKIDGEHKTVRFLSRLHGTLEPNVLPK
jgi:lipopolysaccharide export system protein LptC